MTREVDPATTCKLCPIDKALDLVCQGNATLSSISASKSAALVMIGTRLMTIKATEFAAEAVDQFPAGALTALDASEHPWLFGKTTSGIVALRGSDAAWTSATLVPNSPTDTSDPVLTDAKMVSDDMGYVTYYSPKEWQPHLLSWDGTCWTDEIVGTEPVQALVVDSDSDKRPWVAWMALEHEPGMPVGINPPRSIEVRSPDGESQTVLAGIRYRDAALSSRASLRILPGGLDGKSAMPALAAVLGDGIRVISYAPGAASGWSERLLSEPAGVASTGNCPSADARPDLDDACSGLTTCTEHFSGSSSGFGLARTQSGATFAAWVVYSSEGTFHLKSTCWGGELPGCYCVRTEVSGSGTAYLVLARLTDAEPVVTKLPFALGGAVVPLDDEVAMTTRGDTLLIAAKLSAAGFPTYLEVDANQLP